MKKMFPFLLSLSLLGTSAAAQMPGEAAEPAVSYSDLWMFDADSFSFPEEKRDDLSQCEGRDIAGMMQAIRSCWPVFESYRDTKAFRQARSKAVALVNDPETDIDLLDQAQAEVLREALLVPQVIPEPRYPAQFELALIAHNIRFKQWSRTRQYERARTDANRLIGFYHQGKHYRETGYHNGILHFNRVEMNLAIDNPASDSLIEKPEFERPIAFADFRSVFRAAFYDQERTPPAVLPLGVSPDRDLRPGDCSGRDYAGLLRAIRYCRPIYDLYLDMIATDLNNFPIKPDSYDHIAAKRIVLRAGRLDIPSADYFALIALLFQSGTAYVGDDDPNGDRFLNQARVLIKKSELVWDDDMMAMVRKWPALVDEALARQAEIEAEAAVAEAVPLDEPKAESAQSSDQ